MARELHSEMNCVENKKKQDTFICFRGLPFALPRDAINFWHSQVTCSPAVIEELKRIIQQSEITKEDDNQWPEPDKVGEQNLEIKIGNGNVYLRI